MDGTVKQAKELFVSNLHGTSFSELSLITFVVPFLLEFALIVLPSLTCVTMPHLTWRVFSILAMVAMGFITYSLWKGRRIVSVTSPEQRRALEGPTRPFITALRSYNMILTAIAILAVDFHIFPRRFAKTELYGVSLMDAGVGWIQLFGALTSQKAREDLELKRDDVPRDGPARYGKLLRASLLSALPLFLLGGVRLLVIAIVGYQHHVSEYGVHWNFFFTLCFTSLFFTSSNIPLRYCPVAGVVLLVVYEYALLHLGLRERLLSDQRPPFVSGLSDLIWMNKEGVFSLFGFLALAFFGAYIGSLLLKKRTIPQWQYFTLVLCVVDSVLWIVTMGITEHVDMPSRRLTNAAYVLWTVSFFLFLLVPTIMVNLSLHTAQQSLILVAINRNQLAIFLLANILTGFVNLSIDTLAASDFTALVVLLSYLFVVCGAAVVLHRANITLKFW